MSTEEEILNQIANFTSTEWNMWKKQQEQKSLHRLSFPGFHRFSNKNFQYFDFSKIDFPANEIWNCDFSNTNLIEATLKSTKIHQTDFTGADLSKTDLSCSELTDVNLSHTDLTDVDITYVKFTKVKFNQCVINPKKVNFSETLKTEFKDIECDFVYLNKSKTERYPPSGYFVAGEFEKFIKGEIDIDNPQTNRKLLDGSGDHFRSELNIVNTDAERNQLENEVNFLRNRLESMELQEKIYNHTRVKPRLEIILPICIVSIVFLVFSSILINKVDKQKIEVSVNYDVGIIMGGLLTGSAALIAALSYAKRNHTSNQNNRE